MLKQQTQLVFSLALAVILLVQPCLAHEDPAEELGHHWAVRSYATEIHLQICIIFGGLILFHVAKLAFARLRRKSE